MKKKEASVAKAKKKKSAKVSSKVKVKLKAKVKAKPKAKSKASPKPKPKAKTKSKTQKAALVKTAAKKTSAIKAKLKTAPLPKKSSKPSNLKSLVNVVTPLDDRILIFVAEREKMTAGGLYIPDTVSDVSGQIKGEVVAVGRGRLDKKGKIHPLDVKIGDHVVLSDHVGSKVLIQDQEFLFVRESEVLGVQTK